MGRKGIKPKLLMCAVALSTVVTGILGSIPLPVKAAEEETYTVIFEAYEGTCETERISVSRGESLTLPDGTYEGHYIESCIDAVENDNVTTFRAVGRPGDTYTPERDLWLYVNWKPETELKEELDTEKEDLESGTESGEELEPGTESEEELGSGAESEAEMEPETGLKEEIEPETGLEADSEQEADISYEARIGEDYYEDIESAFENAQEGDTITVLRDCSSPKTLVVSTVRR